MLGLEQRLLLPSPLLQQPQQVQMTDRKTKATISLSKWACSRLQAEFSCLQRTPKAWGNMDLQGADASASLQYLGRLLARQDSASV